MFLGLLSSSFDVLDCYISIIILSISPCSNTDVHTVASLLKLYLRELPEPVIPFCKYEEFLACTKLFSKDQDAVSYFIRCFLFVCLFYKVKKFKHTLADTDQCCITSVLQGVIFRYLSVLFSIAFKDL